MFNGIIYNVGTVKIIKNNSKSKLIAIKSDLRLKKNEIGSSINCNGVCLTLTNINKGLIYFYVSNETIKRSNFKFVKVGDKVNLGSKIIRPLYSRTRRYYC